MVRNIQSICLCNSDVPQRTGKVSIEISEYKVIRFVIFTQGRQMSTYKHLNTIFHVYRSGQSYFSMEENAVPRENRRPNGSNKLRDHVYLY